jgi:hypothetical protein
MVCQVRTINPPKVDYGLLRASRFHNPALHSCSMGPLVSASLRPAQSRRPLDVVGPTTHSCRGTPKTLSLHRKRACVEGKGFGVVITMI